MAGTTETTIKLKVAPSHETKHLAYLYAKAKREMVRYLAENSITADFMDALHKQFYAKLKQRGMPLALILDCYKDAINTYKSWIGVKIKGAHEPKRLPKIKKVSVILTPGITFSFDIYNQKLYILGKETKILGHSKLYFGELAQSRLIKKDDGWYLHTTVRMKERRVRPRGLIAVDINEEFIMAGNNEIVVDIPTRFYDAWHYIKVAEGLKEKYGEKFKYSRRIQFRYRQLYKKAKLILMDSAKKIGKWVVDVATMLNANVIVLEKIQGLDMSKTMSLLFQYKRIQEWIEWQARKHGMKVLYVSPRYSSLTCPKCKGPMTETKDRMVKCLNCGFEDNRDYVAVRNLYGRGYWLLSTALRKSSPEKGE